jgi:hypothetical protein
MNGITAMCNGESARASDEGNDNGVQEMHYSGKDVETEGLFRWCKHYDRMERTMAPGRGKEREMKISVIL